MLLPFVLTFAALADVGPPPECPAGTHREYLYGNHCVRDGYHLETKEGGGYEEVSDAPPNPDQTAPMTPEQPSTPIAEVAAPVEPVPAAPVATETRCATAPVSSVLGLLVALALAATRRPTRATPARGPRNVS